MGLLDYYKQFEGMPEEEVNEQLREKAAERRRRALARIDPIDLSQTTWPELPPSTVVNAVTYVARRGLNRYLDPHAAELRAELSHHLRVPPARVVVGNGAAQLLGAAAEALLEPGDELVTPWPSYPLFPVMARRVRGHAVPVPGFGADAVLRAVNDRTRVVALCNPNDPTGEWMGPDELRSLLEALPDRVALLLDEALADFVDTEDRDATLSLLDDFSRVIVFRTFSKAWGLAGLRCGYAIGAPESEPLLERLEPELGVSELAQAGALEALRTTQHVVARRIGEVKTERAQLLSRLAEMDRIDVVASQANVVWLGVEGMDGAELAARLERAKVIVASGARFGDASRIRAQIQNEAASDRLVDALTKALM